MLRVCGDRVGPDCVLCEGAVTAGPRLQGDRVNSEMLQHVKYCIEPHVLHPALTIRVNSHPDVLCSALEVECQHILPSPGLALPHKEHSVASDGLVEDHGGRVAPGEHPMKPGIL